MNHKDENKTNNCVDNLEWCTAKQNMTFNNLHIRRGKKNRRPILQYTEDGKFIREYESAEDAQNKTGISRNAKKNRCYGKTNGLLKGYYWKFKNDSYRLEKQILQFDVNGKFIAKFSNSVSAGKVIHAHPSCIRRCCYGQQKTAHGYIWKFDKGHSDY